MKSWVKKATALLLSVVLFAALIPSTVFATGENPYDKTVGNAEFEVSTSFCASGNTTKIFVDIGADSQMSAALFVLKFDTTLLKAVSVETGVVLKNGYTSKNITEAGEVMVSYADINPSYEAGRLFEVEFEAVGTIPEGMQFVNIPIVLEVAELRNYEDYKIASTVTNGNITLIDTPYGDVNQSSEVSASDALMALYSNSQLIELDETQKILADVSGDGKVSAADSLLILQYSAGSISNYPIFTLSTPMNLCVAQKDETYVTLSWDEVKNAVGYNVYMDGVKVNDDVIIDASYTVTGLQQDTQHVFTVEAVNCLMASAKSEPLSVSTNKADRTVVFKNYDGTILNSQIVLSGESAVAPTVPARKGYTFTGWDQDISCVTADLVVTAQYEINSYTVTYDYQYDGITSTDTFVYNTLVAEPELLDREDYTLEGWYRDKNFTKKWDFSTDLIEGDTVLYANWVTWSEWTTDTTLLDNALYEVESKVQYSYSDKSTTTSTASSLDGWIQSGSTTSYGAWTNVAWTKTKPTASDTLQITNTKTVTDVAAYTKYNLYYYRYWNSNYQKYYYTWSSGMGGTKYTRTVKSTEVTYKATYDGYKSYTLNDSSARNFSGELWFLASTANVPAVTHTE